MCWKAGCRGLGLNLSSGYLLCVFSWFLCSNAIKTKKSCQNLEGMLIKLNKFMCLGMCIPLVHVRAPVLPRPPLNTCQLPHHTHQNRLSAQRLVSRQRHVTGQQQSQLMDARSGSCLHYVCVCHRSWRDSVMVRFKNNGAQGDRSTWVKPIAHMLHS